MPANLNVDQIVEAVNRLSQDDRQKLIRRLTNRSPKLGRIIERNRPKLLAVCRSRGIDFDSLNEDEREKLIDDIMHED